MKSYICIDLNHDLSGVYLSEFNFDKVSVTRIHVFRLRTIERSGQLFWDFPHLYENVVDGLTQIGNRNKLNNLNIQSLSLCTDLTDFAMLDDHENLMDIPAYKGPVFENEGLKKLNWLYDSFNELFGASAKVLFLTDAVKFMLTDTKNLDANLLSVTQLIDKRTFHSSQLVISSFGLKYQFFANVNYNKSESAQLKNLLSKITLLPPLKYLDFDTYRSCASLNAIPYKNLPVLFLCSDNPGLFGVLEDDLNNTNADFSSEFRQCRLYDGKTTLQRLLNGFTLFESFLVQNYGYYSDDLLVELMSGYAGAPESHSFVDLDHALFVKVNNVQSALKTYLLQTNQAIPTSREDLFYVLFQSFMLRIKFLSDQIRFSGEEDITEFFHLGRYAGLSVFNQLLSNFIGMPVHAINGNAAVFGNMLGQADYGQLIRDNIHKNKILRRNVRMKLYRSLNSEIFTRKYALYKFFSGVHNPAKGDVSSVAV